MVNCANGDFNQGQMPIMQLLNLTLSEKVPIMHFNDLTGNGAHTGLVLFSLVRKDQYH